MVKRLFGLHAKIFAAIGSVASIIAHGASQAEASPFLIEPESIDRLQGIRPYMQSFVQSSNTRFLHGTDSMLATWQGSNLLLIQRGPPERADWE